MANELEQLMGRISELPNEDLLRMVNVDFIQYRTEALAYAKAEIERRGLSFNQTDINGTDPLEYQGGTEDEPIAQEVSDSSEYSLYSTGRKQESLSTVGYEVFRGTMATWDSLFSQAASFASEIGPEKLIGISHSEDKNEGVVTVWYWT